MPINAKDENGLLDGINAAAQSNSLSIIHAIKKETGDPVLLLTCTFASGRKTQMIPIAEIIVGRDMDEYIFPEELRELVPNRQESGDIEVGIPGVDIL